MCTYTSIKNYISQCSLSYTVIRHVANTHNTKTRDVHHQRRLPLCIFILVCYLKCLTSGDTRVVVKMEAMEDDSPGMKDDHNHNYCASSSSKVSAYLSSQLSDVSTVPQPVCQPVSRGEPGARRRKLWSGSSRGSKFMDSDSSSESSEVGEADCTAPPAAAEGKFTLDSTSKFRKLTARGHREQGLVSWSQQPGLLGLHYCISLY